MEQVRTRTAAANSRLTLGGELNAATLDAGLTPEPMAATGLEYIRRRTDDGWIYFITNLTADAFDGWLPLGATAAAVTATDPLTGFEGAPARNADGALRLQLASGESVLLHASAATTSTAAWPVLQPAADPTPLTGDWTLSFTRGGPALPGSVELSAPTDWATLDDPEAQRFAGTGRYRVEFDLPTAPAATTDWSLDLGDVRESARIWINGQAAGSSWSFPHRLRVGPYLQPGRNVLEIEVTNLGANRIRDLDRRGVQWRIMHEINFVNIRYRPFNAADWALMPSGLLGPVTLTPLHPTR